MATSATTIAAGRARAVCHAPPVTADPPREHGAPAPWQSSTQAAEYGRRLLTGPAVAFRASSEADLAQLEQWWLDPAVGALQTDAVRPGPAGSVVERFRGWSANGDEGAVGFSVVTTTGGELAGHVTIWGVTARRRCGTLALLIGPDHRGRGLGLATVQLAQRYAFLELGLHRLQLQVWAYNDRALRCYRAAGFLEEGRRREVTFHDGRWHDEVLMAVLRSEWSGGSLGGSGL